MRPVYPLATALLISAAAGGNAQERQIRAVLEKGIGTSFARFNPEFSDGKLFNCGIEFAVLLKDWTYNKGEFSRISGQFGIMSVRGNPGIILKIIVHDLDLKQLDFKPNPPATAYFLNKTFGTTKSSIVDNTKSDTPGAIFVIFNIENTMELLAEGVSENKVAIAFARRPGGSDIRVIVETDVEETTPEGKRVRGHKTGADFFACAKALLSQP